MNKDIHKKTQPHHSGASHFDDSSQGFQKDFIIEGAGCASCVGKIEFALNKVPGVLQAEMNFAQRTVSVNGSATNIDLINAVEQVGYKAKFSSADNDDDASSEKDAADNAHFTKLMRDMICALALGIPLMVYSLFGGNMTVTSVSDQLMWLIVGLLTLAVMVFSGKHFYVGAWKSACNQSASMDTLIALGTGTAWLYSMMVVFFPDLVPGMARHVYFEATAMIIGLINLGLALELKARSRTSDAIKHLIGLQPKTACVIRDTKEINIAIANVLLNDVVRVRPGERVPVDGLVTEGYTTIDQAMLTGEPMPVDKVIGNSVVAGTINKTGSILIKTTCVGKHTALAQIINMVKRAQNSKPPIGRMADTVAAYFVPTVIIIAVISALIWLNFGPQPNIAFAIVSATTVLIIACPCALGLATPMSVMVGIGKAAEAGVLIRNGEALQTASKITTLILDKTGTITLGAPKVTDVKLANNFTEIEVLQLVASLESLSEHPLALAIVESARALGIELSAAHDFNAMSGFGVEANVDGRQLLFGNEKLMLERGIDLTDYIKSAQDLAIEAKTPMYFVIDNKFAAIIAVADPIKDDSVAAIKRLQKSGIRVVMLTGDNRDTAKAVAKKVGINEFFAEVLPEQKSLKIQEFQHRSEIVGMTGDGINDAPALATADVGFAMGTGTDIAIESADIILIRGSLHGIADAIAVSKATLRNIKQNLFGAFIYNVAGIPLAAGVLYPFFGVLLSPVIAGAAMAFSSFTVVSNANRLRYFKTENIRVVNAKEHKERSNQG